MEGNETGTNRGACPGADADKPRFERACRGGEKLCRTLTARLKPLTDKYRYDRPGWEAASFEALASLYALGGDDAENVRSRVFETWLEMYRALFKMFCRPEVCESARAVIERNIITADISKETVIVSVWTRLSEGYGFARTDYTYAELMYAQKLTRKLRRSGQMSFLADEDGVVEPCRLGVKTVTVSSMTK